MKLSYVYDVLLSVLDYITFTLYMYNVCYLCRSSTRLLTEA